MAAITLFRRGHVQLLAAALILCGAARCLAAETALDRYIAKADPLFAWKLAAKIPGEGYTTYILELTSQTWRTAEEVDRPVWKHWLSIVKPDNAKSSTAFLYIGGGSNKDEPPKAAPARVVSLAQGTNTVVAELGMVPNQPLFFADSNDKGRSEDDLIAYTRVKYIATRDETWLVRLAMVKSGVRAMDAIQQFMAGSEAGSLAIDKFVVAGGSKRGWTTWLVGTVDPRVIAIVPMVIDALNSEAITKHHYEAYGFFSPALGDYVRHKIFPDKVGTPEYREVLAIEDPYNYRDRPRLSIPKFLINASGDQFFLPDNSQFYYAAMPEEKHLRYVPNAKHNLEGSDARESLQAFYQAILDGTPRPKFSWKKEKDGSLVVTAQDRPREVNLWQATNPDARDFRVDTIGKAYTTSPLSEKTSGVYVGQVPKPDKGFTAFFVELVYASGGKYPFKFTTEVSVVPDVLPFRWADALKK
ncbi:MAG: PhoPQ-activated pathogenicity-related family protein [Planctomycetia bacterium]|nr:PhoPQ-activated pathogenicity-related family protein [Planctomycetia bacterium]